MAIRYILDPINHNNGRRSIQGLEPLLKKFSSPVDSLRDMGPSFYEVDSTALKDSPIFRELCTGEKNFLSK